MLNKYVLLAGVIFILIAPETNKVTIIIQVILAAIFLGWLLMYLIANEHTANNVERRERELQYVKESSAKLYSIIQRILLMYFFVNQREEPYFYNFVAIKIL